MILVNIEFQELNRSYDFKLDWDASVQTITDEVLKMISQTEHLPLAKEPGTFLLYKKGSNCALHPNSMLAENGINTGDTLLLI